MKTHNKASIASGLFAWALVAAAAAQGIDIAPRPLERGEGTNVFHFHAAMRETGRPGGISEDGNYRTNESDTEVAKNELRKRLELTYRRMNVDISTFDPIDPK